MTRFRVSGLKSRCGTDTLRGRRRYTLNRSSAARRFCRSWKGRMSTILRGYRPRSRIEQKSTSAAPALRWVPLPRSTTTCACCFARVEPRPRCRIMTCRWRRKPPLARWSITYCMSQPEGKRLMLLAPIIKERKAGALSAGKSAQRGYSRPY